MSRDSPLLVILGPTASGKTALALPLAEQFCGEVVNCDSVSMYREFDIGTAKPTLAERVRVPHHLFDCLDPSAYVTAGEYSQKARVVLENIKARHALPIVVGGTGLYLRALVDGLFAGPKRSEELRARLRDSEQKSAGRLHRLLLRLDPGAAARIHANDIPKLIRAVEVCLTSKETLSGLWQQGRNPLKGFKVFRLGLNPDRAKLYERINQRAKRMFESGLVDETRSLLHKYGASAAPLHALGYKQAGQYIRGEIDLDTAVQAAQQAHRNYAKRQMTWFRREPDVRWLEGFGDDEGIQREALEIVGWNFFA